jgi:hypothetical protein
MVRQLVKTARMRGDAKTVLKSTPPVSAILAARGRSGRGERVPGEGNDPDPVRDVIEPVPIRDPAPRAGRPSPA